MYKHSLLTFSSFAIYNAIYKIDSSNGRAWMWIQTCIPWWMKGSLLVGMWPYTVFSLQYTTDLSLTLKAETETFSEKLRSMWPPHESFRASKTSLHKKEASTLLQAISFWFLVGWVTPHCFRRGNGRSGPSHWKLPEIIWEWWLEESQEQQRWQCDHSKEHQI
jgi:hypothetical protein